MESINLIRTQEAKNEEILRIPVQLTFLSLPNGFG